MILQIGFIMPTEPMIRRIATLRGDLAKLRPDQLTHYEHLLRSWRVFDRYDALSVCAKAFLRTLRDRP